VRIARCHADLGMTKDLHHHALVDALSQQQVGASSEIITAMPQSLSLKLDAYQQRSLVQVNIPPAQAKGFALA